MTEELYTPGRRLHELAQSRAEETALVCGMRDGGTQSLSWRELDQWSSRLAHCLAQRGVDQGSFVAIHLPNGLEHVVVTQAALKLGACPMPVAHKMPAPERDGLLALAKPAAIISDAPEVEALRSADLHALDDYLVTPPTDRVPQPHKAIGSGGSTGRPKLIVSPGAFEFVPDQHPFAQIMRIQDRKRFYSPGPLYHNQAFLGTMAAMFVGSSAIINERFDAATALDIIEQQRPHIVSLVPTMMLRMLRVPGIEQRDLSSIEALWHMAAPCPDWVKRGWIDLIGPEKVLELWGATELTGITTIDGSEWLAKPGSVGRGFQTEFRIIGDDGQQLPPGEIGEIYTRIGGAPAQYSYLGADPLPEVGDGFASVGDLGYVDEDGYLFLSDRRVDMIISGGANVFPAEIEAVVTEHPAVRDAVVVGLRDEELGQRVHAIIEPEDAASPPAEQDLVELCTGRLARYKVPRSWEVIPQLPRNEAGKIRRRALRDERNG